MTKSSTGNLVPSNISTLTELVDSGYMDDVRKAVVDGVIYFSVVDVIGKLTEQPDKRHSSKYWQTLKQRKSDQGIQLSTFCSQLKFPSADGKKYKTDAATLENMLRIIQEVPSPKADLIKQWLAKVGAERIEEEANPEKAVNRAIDTYKKQGKSDKWINRRLDTIAKRKELTSTFQKHGIHEKYQYGLLTDANHKAWTGKTTKEDKADKGIGKKNLRDYSSELELLLTEVAETSARTIIEENNDYGFDALKQDCIEGGLVSLETRKVLESKLGHSIITTNVLTSSNSSQNKLPKK